MRNLTWDNSFRRAFKRCTKNNPSLAACVLETIAVLGSNPFDPALRAHQLHGKLDGLWACSVEYDLRIVFTFEPDPKGEEDMVVLIDLGTHDEVY